MRLVLLLTACDPGDVTLLAPETSGATPNFTIRAVVDTPNAALAASLGWSSGVPLAQIRVHRMDEPAEGYWHLATADSNGLVTFSALLGGVYEVEATRPLSQAETVESNAGTRVLAGGRRMSLPASDVPEVTMVPDHPGSLVFSEFELDGPSDLESHTFYPDAMYIEIYNNSDTTIYLDSKYWGTGWNLVNDYPYWPCAQTEVVRNDPAGIWAAPIFRFPGAGREYPLEPGRTALIAKSAIDHRQVYPFLYDLSQADFEWGGYANPDNPDVPNLQNIGLRLPPIWPGNTDMPAFLAEPVDLGSLPRYVDPHSGYLWVRIPKEAILDVWVGTSEVPAGVSVTSPPCLETTHRYFERLPGPAYVRAQFTAGISYQRRVLTVLPDGRKILQDTNTSMFDFVKAVRTPGWIPDSVP